MKAILCEAPRSSRAGTPGGTTPPRSCALNTHRGALAEAPRLFADWMRPENGVIEVLIEV